MSKAESVPYAADACRNAGFNSSIASSDTSPSLLTEILLTLALPLALALLLLLLSKNNASSCISSSSSPYKYCFDVFFNLASARCSLHSIIPAIGSNIVIPSTPNGFNSFMSIVITRIIARLNSTISHMDEGIVTPETFFKSCFFLKLLLPPSFFIGVDVGAPNFCAVSTSPPSFFIIVVFCASSLASSSSASKTSSGISEGSLECVVLMSVSSSIFSGNTGSVLPFSSFAMMTFDGARKTIPPGNFFDAFVPFVLSKTVSIVDFSAFSLFFSPPSPPPLSCTSSALVDTHFAPLGGTNPPKSSNK
mmetsp:Transcript_122/g.350  ORF Transcript_122/g.350 Transcript_122/m.350 type:complete len:306 (-) Transcript_122:597-1514(-)